MGTERLLTLVVELGRMLMLLSRNLQLDEGKRPDQHAADPVQRLVLGIVATSQLLVRIEKSAQVQPEPMLGSMAVAATADSALASAIERPVRIVQSEPERKAELTAHAAAGAAAQARESTARHLWTASAVMLWQANILVSAAVGECESQCVLQQESVQNLVDLVLRTEMVLSPASEVVSVELDLVAAASEPRTAAA